MLHYACAHKLLYESLPQDGFIHYNGCLEVHSSLLNVLLHDENKLKKETPLLAASLRYSSGG